MQRVLALVPMRAFVYFLLFLLPAHGFAALVCSKRLTDPSSPALIANHKDNYLEMPLPYEPAQDLRVKLEKKISQTLKTRGEAHITVITPVEFEVLKSVLSLDEIAAYANTLMPGRRNRPKAICIGIGQANVDGQLEKTYYVVVSAPFLRRVRHAIEQKFVAKGGKRGAFLADDFYPHITLGFTKRDLYESDGVIKDEKSCVYDLIDPRFEGA